MNQEEKDLVKIFNCPVSISALPNSNCNLKYSNEMFKKLPAIVKSSNERSMSLDAFNNNLPFQSKIFCNNNNFVKKRRNFQVGRQMEPLSARPQTIFGLVPTPQVSMGACFFNIFHNCTQHVIFYNFIKFKLIFLDKLLCYLDSSS